MQYSGVLLPPVRAVCAGVCSGVSGSCEYPRTRCLFALWVYTTAVAWCVAASCSKKQPRALAFFLSLVGWVGIDLCRGCVCRGDRGATFLPAVCVPSVGRLSATNRELALPSGLRSDANLHKNLAELMMLDYCEHQAYDTRSL